MLATSVGIDDKDGVRDRTHNFGSCARGYSASSYTLACNNTTNLTVQCALGVVGDLMMLTISEKDVLTGRWTIMITMDCN